MIRLRSLSMLVIGVLPFTAPAPTAPAQGDGSKIWVGRYQEIEDYLRTAECVNMETLGPSASVRCTLRPGGPVARMAWRPLPPGVHRGFQESYKTEIAAYELDKLLKMDMVPPSVERQIDGNRGAAQLWVENVKDMRGAEPDEAKRAGWESQLTRMTMFDTLIGNHARNLANSLRDPAGNLILIDHSRAFGTDTALRDRLTRVDKSFWARIEGLTRGQLDAALGKWIGEKEIGAILDRREKMRGEIRREKMRGEIKVLSR